MVSLEYCDLYFAKQEMVTSDGTTCSTTLIIKPSLTLDLNTNYRAGKEINLADLEKMLSSSLLVAGRTLIALARKGGKIYRKALSFTVKNGTHKITSLLNQLQQVRM